jgi:sugar phosphate isomerase/epimerase
VELRICKSLWGMNGSLEENVNAIEDAGYDAFEFDLPENDDELSALRSVRRSHDLPYYTLIRTSGPDHLTSFRRLLERAERAGADFVTSSSSTDSASFDDKLRFFEGALRIQSEFELPVAHETHRQTALFTPWDTAKILLAFPELKLTADYSHWCCVSESTLDEHSDSVALGNAHSIHIHGRVGHPGGPQVNDPRAPENRRYLQCHEAWWADIIRRRQADQTRVLSFDPEFGPPGTYMPAVPYTREPLADLWDTCLWMADRFRSLFASVVSGSGTHAAGASPPSLR